MLPKLKDMIERAQSWPDAAQDEAVRSLLAIEERHGGPYSINDAEWTDLQEGIAQADRKELVSDEVMAEADKRHGAIIPR